MAVPLGLFYVLKWEVKKTAKLIPELNVTEFEDPFGFIFEFYKVLGWNNEAEELDPKKILIHLETWGKIV